MSERDSLLSDWATYVVIPDGVGEFGADYSVLLVKARTRREAAEIITSPAMGYGSDSDGRVFVCPLDYVSAFTINPLTVRTIEPSTAESLILEVHERPAPASVPITPRGGGKPIRPRRKG